MKLKLLESRGWMEPAADRRGMAQRNASSA
jgi:hypothetical protein